ncbi:MAG: ankyrin repeat domain-containing protein [Verrucomicrobiota bacterium]
MRQTSFPTFSPQGALGILLACFLVSCGERDEGVTSLMIAANDGNLTEVERLLSSGADVDEKSAYAWTPLMFAARAGHAEVVSALLEAGAEVETVSSRVPAATFATRGGAYPTTALAEALENNHEEIANLLLAKTTSIHPIELVIAAGREDATWLEKLVAAGGDPKATTPLPYHGSPLCAAASAGNLEAVQWLVFEQGVDVNQRVKGTNPLEQAVRNDHVEIVSLLLNEGADPNATYKDSTMPTILLVAMKKPMMSASLLDRNVSVIELLVEHGADPSLEPDYSVFGLGIIGEKRNAIAVAQAKVDEYEEYHASATDPEWSERSKKFLQHREAIVEMLTRVN